MDTPADPGELLAGLEASINVFQGTTRSTQTFNSKRMSSKLTHAQRPMCLIEDREIEIICGLYAQPLKKDEDDPMGEAGQSEGAGQPASFGAASSSTEENAERSSRSASQSTQNTPGVMPDAGEEYQIPRDKGQVMDAICRLFSHWPTTTCGLESL